MQRDPPAAAKRGKSPIPPRPACAGLLLPGALRFLGTHPTWSAGLGKGERRKSRSLRRLCRSRVCQSRQKQKSPGRGGGRSPARGFAALWDQTARAKAPLLCTVTGGRRGIPAKKAADAALRGIASAAFCMVILFWVAFGKVRVCAVPPPGRKTRRPVFQPLCHACRMVSSAGAWQKE